MTIENIRKFMGLGLPAELAKVLAEAMDAPAGSVAWINVTGKPATFDPTIGTGANTAKSGDYVPAWDEVIDKPTTFAPIIGTTATTALAGNTSIPAASSTEPAALAVSAAVGVGTTFARADHVHAIPGASNGTVRGTVLRQAAIPNVLLVPTASEFNAVLAALRAAGIIAT